MCKRNYPTQIVLNFLDGHGKDIRALADKRNFRDETALKGGLVNLIFEVLGDEEYDGLWNEITDYFFQEVDFDEIVAVCWGKE